MGDLGNLLTMDSYESCVNGLAEKLMYNDFDRIRIADIFNKETKKKEKEVYIVRDTVRVEIDPEIKLIVIKAAVVEVKDLVYVNNTLRHGIDIVKDVLKYIDTRDKEIYKFRSVITDDYRVKLAIGLRNRLLNNRVQ